MEETGARQRRRQARSRHYEEFYQRLLQRRPGAKSAHDELVRKVSGDAKLTAEVAAKGLAARALAAAHEAPTVDEIVLETLVRRERPVLFVQDDWINKTEVTADGEEARELIAALDGSREKLSPLMPLIGRIDVANFSGASYLGTGWFVTSDILVTNRHVASLVAAWDGRQFVFRRGVAGKETTPSVCTAHEFDDLAPDQARSFAVKEVLYIEADSSPNDIAFLRVVRRTDGTRRDFIPVAEADLGADSQVVVIGYPARASKDVIPDQQRMNELFRGRYDVKRASPGLTMPAQATVMRHDCTTLGGNSGSVVLDLKSGMAVGLHYAGLYDESNYAVRASVLADYVKNRRWLSAPLIGIGGVVEVLPAQPAARVVVPQAGAGDSVTVDIPLSITLRVGPPAVKDAGSTARNAVSPAAAEAAARDFWDQRPDGVVAVRVGFLDDGESIGDVPFIAASVPAERLAEIRAAAPARFKDLEVGYFAADLAELVEGRPELEAAQSIAYDDEARTGPGYSFDKVDEQMSVTAHVGPEYSWDELKAFLGGASGSLVSAIYEFHGKHIAEAIEERLEAGTSVQLVMDNATFIKVKDKKEEFDRVPRFKSWEKYANRFKRVVVPEGSNGLIANAYHIKVTVRQDDTFWLSSGNWKMGSSQPVVTQAQRDNSINEDLPGNREWHVVVRNETLAGRLRNHIKQDFKRSTDLGGGKVPMSREAADVFVDIPIEAALERKPPSRLLAPQTFTGRIGVKPLLTPDKEGAVYSKAVLELIRSARDSLLFQIPYIGMPPNPRADRGFIDELIEALTRKLKTLRDARVLLRSGGSAYSSPTHAAWYFKSKGVKVRERVRRIENHHTKGMIVDGKRVLIGSHNWSQPGVSLNRDASLLFDNAAVAGYFAEAFEVDWARATQIPPKRYVKSEGPVLVEAAGAEPAPGYRRGLLSELLKEAD